MSEQAAMKSIAIMHITLHRFTDFVSREDAVWFQGKRQKIAFFACDGESCGDNGRILLL
jgi:hypothetical protein